MYVYMHTHTSTFTSRIYCFDILSMLVEFFSLKVKVNFSFEFSTFKVEVYYYFFLSPLERGPKQSLVFPCLACTGHKLWDGHQFAHFERIQWLLIFQRMMMVQKPSQDQGVCMSRLVWMAPLI